MRFGMRTSDGVSEVRKATREQMRQGADHIKIMMSGGVASPYDPLDSLQFSPGEVAAAVEEAHAFGRYVAPMPTRRKRSPAPRTAAYARSSTAT